VYTLENDDLNDVVSTVSEVSDKADDKNIIMLTQVIKGYKKEKISKMSRKSGGKNSNLILDNGASVHVLRNKRLFKKLKPV